MTGDNLEALLKIRPSMGSNPIGDTIRSLMEIMRAQIQAATGKRQQARCFDVDYAILILQKAFDKQKLALCHDEAIPLIEIRSNDDVGDPHFVFHRKKDEALGRAWPLPRDDAAGCPHKLSIAALSQVVRRQDSL